MKKNRLNTLPMPKRSKQQQSSWRASFVKEQAADSVGTVTPVDITATQQPQDVSLDQKVDRYFIQYEKEATGVGDRAALSERSILNLRGLISFLFEQEDPAAAGDAAGGGGGEDLAAAAGADPFAGGGGGDAGGGGAETAEPTPVPKININSFASNLARLVNNYEALLDPRTIILRRAQAYIMKNYSEKVAKELMTIMELQHDMSIKTDSSRELDAPPAPFAIGAGMEGGGLGGGGGA